VNDRRHNVTLRVGGKLVEAWTSYQVALSMLHAADQFSLSIAPYDRALRELCAPDRDVQVLLDDVAMISGFIDSRPRRGSRAGAEMTITGRDKGGRLIDESAPLVTYNGLGILDLARKLAAPWFENVVLSNATNRRLIRGKGAALAGVAREPAIDTSPRARKNVEPGESRWQVLTSFLEEAGLLAWSSADGKTLIVGLPNYEQAAQYRFVAGGPDSLETNVLDWAVEDDIGERYSQITVCGASRGDSANYGANVTKRRAVVVDGPLAHGTGNDFFFPKRLIISDGDVRDMKQAKTRAEKEQAERDGTSHAVNLTVPYHAQWQGAAAVPVLYAPDTIARVVIEEEDIDADYLITDVSFTGAKESETTSIRLVPKGTRLRLGS
jgi:prophage tail gpP-like protein